MRDYFAEALELYVFKDEGVFHVEFAGDGDVCVFDEGSWDEESEDLVDVKGINVEPYPLDMELIQQSDKSVWDAQVRAIQEGLTNEVIENAFLQIPAEVRDENIEDIKYKLRARKGNLQAISDRYYDVINRFAVIKGTNKDD